LYAACKASLAIIGRQLAERDGVSFAWARVFQPYGPGEHPDRLVSACIRSVLAGRRFDATAGTQVRDFVHVDDVASALLTLAEASVSNEVNVCSGEPSEVREVLAAIGRITGRPELIAVGALTSQRWDPPFLYGENTRLRALGWQPRFTLQTGLADAVAWWSEAGVPGSERKNSKELTG
jgi:nucleoside-diphosphate-sugar epimerase